MKERWRDVVGYKGYYRVSSNGRVRTVARIVVRSNGSPQTIRRRFLKLTPGGRYGHILVKLYREKCIGTGYGVHCLVLKAFVGPCPDGMECCHEDGDPTNNKLRNLRWDTPKNNMADRERHGHHAKGTAVVGALFNEKKVRVIRKMLNEANGRWGSLTEIGKKFGASAANIRDIRDGRTWAWLDT